MPTKRVNKSRFRTNILRSRRFEAAGSWNTVFAGVTAGYTAATFGNFQTVPMVTPLASKLGLKSVARNFAVLAGPSLLGVYMGVRLFGNNRELWNLFWNGRTYNKEFKSIKSELYWC